MRSLTLQIITALCSFILPMLGIASEAEVPKDKESPFIDMYIRQEGSSGGGSRLETTVAYRAFLQNFLTKNDIRSVVDVRCGDWEIGRAIRRIFNRNLWWFVCAWKTEFSTLFSTYGKIVTRSASVISRIFRNFSSHAISKKHTGRFFCYLTSLSWKALLGSPLQCNRSQMGHNKQLIRIRNVFQFRPCKDKSNGLTPTGLDQLRNKRGILV